jgi:hypothetical protein
MANSACFCPIDVLQRVLLLWLRFFFIEAECLPSKEMAVILGGAPIGFLMSVYLRWWYVPLLSLKLSGS